MNAIEYDRMYENEDRYWWFVSRRRMVLDLIRRSGVPPDATLLDIGCGTGANLEALRPFGRVAGLDFSGRALECCRRRDLPNLIQGSAESLPLDDATINVIVATDIIEHLENDQAALREFFRVLKPGGYAVITVPAYQFLWSEHDKALMHKRRYVASQLAQRSADAGFQVDRLTYAFSLLFPLALGRLFRRRSETGRSAEAKLLKLPAPINASLIQIQRFEAAILRLCNLPWGLSVVSVIRKPAIPGWNSRAA